MPGKKHFYQSDALINAVVIDVTESPIERPKKNIHQFYSGKKKRHTLKSQVIVNQETGEIICTGHDKGKMHDFHLFKQSQIALTGLKRKLKSNKGIIQAWQIFHVKA